MTKRCCFLSMDDMAGYVADDDLAIAPLNSLGWSVDTVSWRDAQADWNSYDLVVIRTTWDYQKYPEAFLETLATIESSSARLENPLEIVRWNLDKRYLREVESRGLPIVPTIWDAKYEEGYFDAWLEELGASEVVIKPTISATAQNTFRLTAFDPSIEPIFAERDFMVQPFVEEIASHGEYSLFFFNGELSHTILKRPKTGDFRVQEEHGGIITEVEAAPEVLNAAQRWVDILDVCPLYIRVDLVPFRGELALMELELIEPALYLRMNNGAPERFAAAIDSLFQ